MNTVAQALTAIVDAAACQPWQHLHPDRQARILAALAPGNPPQCWVAPRTTEQLAAVITIAQQQGWRVLPCGQGSKLHWGGLAQDIDLVVSTECLDRLIDHAVGDLTVTAEAGMPFARLQKTLAKAGQFLAIDPLYASPVVTQSSDREIPADYSPQATLGGIIATGDTGSLRQSYNSVRDMVLGISWIRADGKLVKAGGRVVKNVAGYDLMKLLTGSYGSLGIVTEVTLRLYPIPSCCQQVIFSGASQTIAQACQMLSKSALTPTAIDLLSSPALQMLTAALPPRSPELGASDLGLVVGFQSLPEAVSQQVTQCIAVGKALGLSTLALDPSHDMAGLPSVRTLINLDSAEVPIVGKFAVPSTQATTLLQDLTTLVPASKAVIHAGSGVGWVGITEARSTQLQTVRSHCQALGGYFSLLQAPLFYKQHLEPWGYSGNALSLMQRIKQQFDPTDRFSPDRFVGGI
jgi:glycolate oxidase FAD binding subunit